MKDYGTLLTFKELEIQGTESSLATLGNKLTATLPATVWSRDPAKEQCLAQQGIWKGTLVFNRVANMNAAAGSLSLVLEHNEAYLGNIVPLELGELSMAEYNAILDDFVASGIAPLANKLGLAFQVTGGNRSITDWLSERAAKKLQAFSSLANRATGTGHPYDYARWTDFLVQAYRDGARLDPDLLRRWLTEIEHWPDSTASRLASEYDLARDVLKKYSETQAQSAGMS